MQNGVSMNKYLEYQKLDSEIFKLERELNKNEHKKDAQAMVGVVKEAQSKIIYLDKQSRFLLEEIEKLKQVQQKGIALVNKYTKQFNANMTEEELADLKGKLSQTIKQLSDLENRFLAHEVKAKNIMQEFDVAKKKANQAKAKHLESKQKFEEVSSSQMPEINKLKSHLQELEKQLDANFVTKYKSLKQDGKFPVIVPLIEKRCGGCRMELPSGQIEIIKQKGKLECPSCKRLIYINKED